MGNTTKLLGEKINNFHLVWYNISMRTKRRSVLGITFLTIVTLGLYQVYWYFITKTEMNTVNGRDVRVPFFLWFFVPVIRIWWFWRFAKGIEKTTKGTLGRWTAFLAPVVLDILGSIFLVSVFPNYTIAEPNMVPAGLTALVFVAIALLPIYFYQASLNKFAR